MTKNELIQWLEKYVEVSKAAIKQTSELRKAEEKEKELKKIVAMPIEPLPPFFGLLAPMVLFGVAILVFLWCTLFEASTVTSIVITGLGVVTVIVVFLIWFIYQRRRDKENKNEAEIALPKVMKKLNEINDRLIDTLMDLSLLEQQNILPEPYSEHQAASKILEYLKNGRADTLKEAMNLYENERFQERMYRENQRHHRQMEDEQLRQTEELKKARREAERAAETAEQAAKQAQKDANFDRFANAVILDAALKDDRRKRGYDN